MASARVIKLMAGAGVGAVSLIAFAANLNDAREFVCSTPLRTQCADWGWVEASSAAAGPVETVLLANLPDGDFVFADSHIRLISQRELDGLTLAQLRIARNEIFARRGRRFESPDLQAHFAGFSWYRAQHEEVTLNAIESQNVQRMRAEEMSR